MGRYTGPKHKLARREGLNILEKQSRSLDRRLNVLPGSHGRRGRKKFSEYGIQLREKQKLKRIYGLYERQFRNYVKKASKSRENTEEKLIHLLERRLDNMIFRLGFAKTRPMARQLVSHRHVLVNNRKVNIPSYEVHQKDTIALSSKLLQDESIKKMLEERETTPPYVERKGALGRLLRFPTKDEVSNPVDYQLVVEYYSR